MMGEYIISARTHKGNVRDTNQDNFFCNGVSKSVPDEANVNFEIRVSSEERILLAVFDGMGGLSSGEIAADIAARTLRDESWRNGKDLPDVIQTINKEVCKENRRLGIKMGSTCVILENDEDRIRCFNVGDSRAYLYRRGELLLLTKDHIEEHHKHTLTQYLGIDEDDFIVEPYVSEWIELEKNDVVLMCSDGLYGMVQDDVIADIISNGNDIETVTQSLETEALKEGGRDNITLIAMK